MEINPRPSLTRRATTSWILSVAPIDKVSILFSLNQCLNFNSHNYNIRTSFQFSKKKPVDKISCDFVTTKKKRLDQLLIVNDVRKKIQYLDTARLPLRWIYINSVPNLPSLFIVKHFANFKFCKSCINILVFLSACCFICTYLLNEIYVMNNYVYHVSGCFYVFIKKVFKYSTSYIVPVVQAFIWLFISYLFIW